MPKGDPDGVMRPTAFKAHDLSRLVEALHIVEDELSFQVHRLETFVTPRTEEEAQHLEQLKNGYAAARPVVRTLKRYHEGRLEWLRAGDISEPDDAGELRSAIGD